MRKTNLGLAILVALVSIASWAGAAGAPGMAPAEALKMLLDGNGRYLEGKPQYPLQDRERRTATASQGQKAWAAVLACSDSRVPVELIFDRGLGDLFVVRVAGNVAGVDEIASLEYAGEHLGIPLLVVLGHSKCEAVTAVVENAPLHGSMPALAAKIKPAVDKFRSEHLGMFTGEALVGLAIKANIWQAMEDLFRNSQIIRDRVKAGKMSVAGALYALETGRVHWLGPHPAQEQLLGPASAPGAKPGGVVEKKADSKKSP